MPLPRAGVPRSGRPRCRRRRRRAQSSSARPAADGDELRRGVDAVAFDEDVVERELGRRRRSEQLRRGAQEAEALRFDKALCFGMFAYLSDASAQQLLASLNQRFLRVRSIFIGNIPDPACAANFFKGQDLAGAELDNPQTQIGVWRAREQIVAMAQSAGLRARFQDMSPDFYQAHYRYNAIVERPI